MCSGAYRRTLSQLFEASAERLPKFLQFVQELALIRTLTLEQISEVVVASVDEVREQLGEKEGNVSFNISQTFPISRPEWSLGYLLLAGQRSQVEITIANTKLAPIVVTGDAFPDEFANTEPVSISIGPGTPTFPPRSSLRAKMVLDIRSKTLSVNGRRMSADDTGSPLIWLMNAPKTVGPNVAKTQITLSRITSELSVGDVVTFSKAAQLFSEGNLRTIISLEGREVSDISNMNIGSIAEGLDTLLAERIALVDPAISYPVYLHREFREQLIDCSIDEVHSTFSQIMKQLGERKMLVTTIFLRYRTTSGDDYYEEDLGIQHPRFGFGPPVLEGENILQDDIRRQWEEGVQFVAEATYRESVETLAQQLRNWVANINQPFPFGFSQTDLMFHYAKTRLSITFDRVIDRGWYSERRMVVRLRPLARHEQYVIEKEYWSRCGDVARVEMLQDMIQKAMPK